MLDYKNIFSIKPFSLNEKEKDKWYYSNQKKLTAYHFKNCKEYKKITNKIHGGLNKSKNLSELPFIPSNLFKDYNLVTNNNDDFMKTLTSSGTSGSKNSIISLDRKTSLLQSRALSNIFQDILNKKRGTMFVVDSPKVFSDFKSLNARGAAIKGFSQLVDKTVFLLDKDLNLKINLLIDFLKTNPKQQFIIFGFTSFIWQYLIKKIKNKKLIPANNGILIHGGGWKKMQDQAVGRDLFNIKITNTVGIKKIHNYYGMVEQTGSVFLECEHGFFHSSIFSDIIVRDADLKISPLKKEGLLQVFSLLPLSYPGHNILTEDVGALQGIDNCKCGRKGKYFYIKGRVPGTEIRGCSDTN
jgi:phenylacetate-coenzyme A ligase PaaK-like adenylate-forming protein